MTWLDEHPEAVEAAAREYREQLFAFAAVVMRGHYIPPWMRLSVDEYWSQYPNERVLDVERVRPILAAASAAAPVEYQWGVRTVGETEPHSTPSGGLVAALRKGFETLDPADELVRRTVGQWEEVHG